MVSPQVGRICAYCFNIFDVSAFPADKRSKGGVAHYCKGCVDTIAQDKFHSKNKCALCGKVGLINRKICMGCKKVIVEANSLMYSDYHQAYYGRMLWLFQTIENAIPILDDDERTIISMRCKRHNVRAVVNGYIGILDPVQVEILWMSQNGLCLYSNKPLVIQQTQLDHILPLARGGTNTLYNIAFVDANLNQKKSAKSLLQFSIDEGLNYESIVQRIKRLHVGLLSVGYTDVTIQKEGLYDARNETIQNVA